MQPDLCRSEVVPERHMAVGAVCVIERVHHPPSCKSSSVRIVADWSVISKAARNTVFCCPESPTPPPVDGFNATKTKPAMTTSIQRN